ncbi:hypothetical protein BLNAU_18722 [Blattamonas nauphoetae]|uniref:Uncharacterized protein n=1 Tax=Blattamonas nauphoetae TaxID=2049346 RepID=A0ABQ9X6V4_9EUKA|nr:hypothetical protein BLNAU_18722 [Blattamonas nauphoetae]
MYINKSTVHPDIDTEQVKQTNFLETFLSQVCGECKTLRPIMLNDLLLVTKSDWALSTILDMEYIKPLEQYCERIQLYDVPTSLPKLLSLIAKTSEGECLRICESSIPSFFLKWMISISDKNMITELGNCLLSWTSTLRSSSTFLAHHKTQFLVFIDHLSQIEKFMSTLTSTFRSSSIFVENRQDKILAFPDNFELKEQNIPHLTILAQLCFSPHLEVSKIALNALLTQSLPNSEIRSFLRTFKVPSSSADSSSELVPFARRLCSTLAEHVSEMKSLFTESSPSDGTISALSTTLPEKSPILSENAVVKMLYDELSLLNSLFHCMFDTFHKILIDCELFPLLKSTIVFCLDRLEHEKNESNNPLTDRTDVLLTVLDSSWNCVATIVRDSHKLLHPIVESSFSSVPQLCSLLERTCCHSSPTRFSHIQVITNIAIKLCHLIPHMLEENLVERVINASRPMTVPTSNGGFHVCLVHSLTKLIEIRNYMIHQVMEWKRIRILLLERVLQSAKHYLLFILQQEEFIPNFRIPVYKDRILITVLLEQTLLLERDLFKDGEIVETGREKWEVGWLVEKTKEYELEEKLIKIRVDDEKMIRNEKERWKKRVERQQEAGHEDAIEGWLMRRDYLTPSEIVEYLQCVGKESGMNVRF